MICSAMAPAAEVSEEIKLKNIQEKLQIGKQKLLEVKKEEQAVLGRLVVINKELKQTNNSLNQANKKITTNQAQIGVLNAELKETAGDLEQKENKLKARVREVYKSSGLNFLQLLFTSGAMSDFLNRLYFCRQIIDYDATLVQGVRADVERVNRKKSTLQTKTKQIQELAAEIESNKVIVAEKAKNKNLVYKELQQRRKEYEAHVAELEKSSSELEVLILKKMAARTGARVYGSGTLAWPLRGRLTSQFGYRRHPLYGGRNFHTGLDIAAKYGTPIMAADAGEVIFSGWWDGYGKAVVIDHGKKTSTVYAHMSRIYKNVGAIVAKGQVVGLVGSTGYSTGPHLHFEVRKNGKPQNPLQYL
ncbi:hypothetical protein A3H38_06140 [candidate division WOR-1 bacterium RIFCSPLOWO2_02_FULL_46_20]|uniref:Uncharacterized protein n=1 Tax=candidate division WOR-1 bacterium RIFCSPLOWO2_02_FULL_46_20 TaxID=1802567 RepID=A0A1F4RBJ3_UNCSA|nr:MAG: hypothetical protein A3H38_06140 [candidate division WOR-1 bacterium RIFCSPLOWO2_02_FULL_46_20]